MATRLATDRVGNALEESKGPDGKPAAIIHAGTATGFSASDISDLKNVDFDFFNNEHGRLAVRITQILSGDRKGDRGTWEFTAVENRDPKGLAGFTAFAKGLGISGAQLANLIAGFKPSGS
jgi:hypothetical protein